MPSSWQAGRFPKVWSCHGRRRRGRIVHGAWQALAVAAKVFVRVHSGIDFADAVQVLIDQAIEKVCRFGLISLDAAGTVVVGNTRDERILHPYFDDQSVGTFRHE
jgi:hypothetical protein